MLNRFNFITAIACLTLLLACGHKENHSLQKPAELIPAPVELNVRAGSVCSEKLADLPQKVKISKEALLRRLNGQQLTDWQLKSAYWLEIGERKVKIEAADEYGAYYAATTLENIKTNDTVVRNMVIEDYPDYR